MTLPSDIVRLMSADSSSPWRGGSGVSEPDIKYAEELVGLRFPPSYRSWLRQYGVGFFETYELNGVFPRELRGDDLPLVGDVAVTNQNNRHRPYWNPGWLELLNFEGDEIYFLDTTKLDYEGEAPVMLIEVGQERPELYARDFFDFLRKMANA
jgi:hypothetical protein